MNIKLTQLAPNFTAIQIHTLTLWFSYQTCIAAHTLGQLPVIAKNEWSATTGQHINKIPGIRTADRVTKIELDEYVQNLINNLEKWNNE